MCGWKRAYINYQKYATLIFEEFQLGKTFAEMLM